MKKVFTILFLVFSFRCFAQQATFYMLNNSCIGLGVNNLPNAAFSFRLLTNCYKGYDIRVRRSSDNSVNDFGFTSGFVDTNSIKTFIGSSDAFIETWYDQSGKGNNVTQSTTGQQPKIATAGALLYQDGRLCAFFDGSNDALIKTGYLIAGSGTSYFAVSKRVSGQFNAIFTGTAASTGYQGSVNSNLTGQARAALNNSGTTDVYVGTPNTNINLCTAIFYATTQQLASDGTSTNTGTNSGATWSGPFNLALGAISRSSSVYSQGYLYEAILYNRSEISDRTIIESNIKTYYGL